jgi:uncharacterized protein YndB with AHSA1/START domain
MSDPQKATRRRESIVVENDLPDPPERVWRALTDPSLLEAWLLPTTSVPRLAPASSFAPGR